MFRDRRGDRTGASLLNRSTAFQIVEEVHHDPDLPFFMFSSDSKVTEEP